MSMVNLDKWKLYGKYYRYWSELSIQIYGNNKQLEPLVNLERHSSFGYVNNWSSDTGTLQI